MVALVVRNRWALFIWAFAAVWCSGVLAGTALLWLEELPAGVEGFPEGAKPFWAWIVLVMFWGFGLGLVAFALKQPLVTLQLWPGGRAELVLQWLLKRRVLALRASELRMRLHESTDSDGDPYFHLKLTAGAKLATAATVAEGAREDCVAVRDRLLAAGVAMAVDCEGGIEPKAGD